MILAYGYNMKKSVLYVLGFLLMSILSSYGQTDVQNKVKAALKAGNSRVIELYMASSLEVKTDKTEATMNKNQATVVLKDFFRAYPPKTFEYNHLGESPGGSVYGIGTYESYRGTFRVYLKFSKSGGQFKLDTVEFTEEI